MARVHGLVLAVLGVASIALSQRVVWRIPSPSVGPFGDDFAVIGDRDGDGHDDVVRTVWIPIYPGAIEKNPHAWVYSGRTGALLAQDARLAGRLATAGDVSGDGIGDYWVQVEGAYLPMCAPWWCPRFEVWSGIDDSVLFQIDLPWHDTLGHMMVGDLDLDGDGSPDVLLGTVFGAGGILYAVSPRNGVLYSRPAQPGEQYGPGLGKFIDYDGDGSDDFLVGMLGAAGAPNGAVDIRSGRNGSLLRRLFCPPAIFGWGQTAQQIGDLDGDGVADVVVGDSGPFSPGQIAVLGSVSGAVIWQWQVNPLGADDFGYPAVACVDVDRDGFDDVLANAFVGNYGQYAFSGRDGSLIQRFVDPGGTPRGNFEALPLQPSDPFPRWVAYGTPLPSSPSVPSTIMFSGAPVGVDRTGMGAAGTLPSMPILGLRALLPSGFRVTLAGAEPGAYALLVIGFQQLGTPLDLSPFGFLNGFLYPQPDLVGFFQAGTSWPDAGYAAHDFAQNLVPATAPGAMAAHLQWVVFGGANSWPGGVSEAMRVFVQ